MKNFNVIEAKKYIANTEQKEFEIIDVRTREEYNLGHIKNSKLYPLDEIYTWSNYLQKNKKYLIYCRSGGRSSMASNYLESIGIDAINISGGIIQWENEKLPIEKNKL